MNQIPYSSFEVSKMKEALSERVDRDFTAYHKTGVTCGLPHAFGDVVEAEVGFMKTFMYAHRRQRSHRSEGVKKGNVELFTVEMTGH